MIEISRQRYNTFWNEASALERKIAVWATWETRTRDRQLVGQRGQLETVFSAIETVCAAIRTGDIENTDKLSDEDLESLAEKLARCVAKARRVLDQPQGRYRAASL